MPSKVVGTWQETQTKKNLETNEVPTQWAQKPVTNEALTCFNCDKWPYKWVTGVK